MTDNLLQALSELKIPYRESVSLSDYTTFRTGGVCSLMILPDSAKKATEALSLLRGGTRVWHIIGNGSNILAPDFPGSDVYLCTSGLTGITVETLPDGGLITAESGVKLSKLASEACKNGLGGLEFAHGIPGSTGGACVMNAGAYGGQISDVIDSTHYINRSGETLCVSGKEHEYGYRKSVFTGDDLLLCSSFRLRYREEAEIKALMNELASKRRASQPLEYPSAGSVFKRPEGYFAGKLIQDAGLKGCRIGGAEVSEKHAGFIINRGGATSSDVLRLIEHIIDTVYSAFGVRLEPEIRIIRGEQ